MRALITGVTGQDGAYLAQLLTRLGYEVFGAYRRSAQPNTWRLDYLDTEVEMVPFELGEYENIKRTIDKVKPDMHFKDWFFTVKNNFDIDIEELLK